MGHCKRCVTSAIERDLKELEELERRERNKIYKERNGLHSKNPYEHGHNYSSYNPGIRWGANTKTKTNHAKVTVTTRSTPTKLETDALVIALDAVSLLIKKHNDYGPKNIADAPGGPLNGLAVRLHDKVARLSNLISNKKTPSNESLEDTFIDILNYGVIGLLVLNGKWDN
jgi:hypothetical protein